MDKDEGPELLYVDKDNKHYYDDIEFIQGYERKDQFIFAMAFGFINNFKPQINKREFITRTSYLKEDESLLNAIALKDTGSIDILSDKKEIYSIAERYANGGIQLLSDEVGSKHGSFEKKIEKILTDLYDEIVKEISQTEPEPKSWIEHILMGESSKTEFKSTMIWNIVENKKDKKMTKIIAKSIAGFMNTNGGTLLIGIEDDGNIYGIEKDLEFVNKNDEDGYQQYLTHAIGTYLGKDRVTLVEPSFAEKDGKKICIVDIKPSNDPVFMKCNKVDKKFFIRSLNSTHAIEGEELVRYTKQRPNFT